LGVGFPTITIRPSTSTISSFVSRRIPSVSVVTVFAHDPRSNTPNNNSNNRNSNSDSNNRKYNNYDGPHGHAHGEDENEEAEAGADGWEWEDDLQLFSTLDSTYTYSESEHHGTTSTTEANHIDIRNEETPAAAATPDWRAFRAQLVSSHEQHGVDAKANAMAHTPAHDDENENETTLDHEHNDKKDNHNNTRQHDHDVSSVSDDTDDNVAVAEAIAAGSDTKRVLVKASSTAWAFDTGDVLEQGTILLHTPPLLRSQSPSSSPSLEDNEDEDDGPNQMQQNNDVGLQHQFLHKSVILLLQYNDSDSDNDTDTDDDQTVQGVLLNRRTKLSLPTPSSLSVGGNDENKIDGKGEGDTDTLWNIWYGGDQHGLDTIDDTTEDEPTLFCLHSLGDIQQGDSSSRSSSSRQVIPGIYVSPLDAAQSMVRAGHATPSDFWTFCGMMEWENPKALSEEVHAHKWQAVSTDSHTILTNGGGSSNPKAEDYKGDVEGRNTHAHVHVQHDTASCTWSLLRTMLGAADDTKSNHNNNNKNGSISSMASSTSSSSRLLDDKVHDKQKHYPAQEQPLPIIGHAPTSTPTPTASSSSLSSYSFEDRMLQQWSLQHLVFDVDDDDDAILIDSLLKAASTSTSPSSSEYRYPQEEDELMMEAFRAAKELYSLRRTSGEYNYSYGHMYDHVKNISSSESVDAQAEDQISSYHTNHPPPLSLGGADDAADDETESAETNTRTDDYVTNTHTHTLAGRFVRGSSCETCPPYLLDHQELHHSIILVLDDEDENGDENDTNTQQAGVSHSLGVILNHPTTESIDLEFLAHSDAFFTKRTLHAPLRHGGPITDLGMQLDTHPQHEQEQQPQDNGSITNKHGMTTATSSPATTMYLHMSPHLRLAKVGTPISYELGRERYVWQCTLAEVQWAISKQLATPSDFMAIQGICAWPKTKTKSNTSNNRGGSTSGGIQAEIDAGRLELIPQTQVKQVWQTLQRQTRLLTDFSVEYNMKLAHRAWTFGGRQLHLDHADRFTSMKQVQQLQQHQQQQDSNSCNDSNNSEETKNNNGIMQLCGEAVRRWITMTLMMPQQHHDNNHNKGRHCDEHGRSSSSSLRP
jgi:putative AlgH/UPF0301 family transcriptional regulator